MYLGWFGSLHPDILDVVDIPDYFANGSESSAKSFRSMAGRNSIRMFDQRRLLSKSRNSSVADWVLREQDGGR